MRTLYELYSATHSYLCLPTLSFKLSPSCIEAVDFGPSLPDMADSQDFKTEPGNGALTDSGSPPQEKTESAPNASRDDMDSPDAEWKASKSTKLAFASICVLALMAALDGTSIGVALPVGTGRKFQNAAPRRLTADANHRPSPMH